MPKSENIPEILVCSSDDCWYSGGDCVYAKLEGDTRHGSDYTLRPFGCMRICEAAPVLAVCKEEMKIFGNCIPPNLRVSTDPVHNYNPEDIDGFIKKEIL